MTDLSPWAWGRESALPDDDERRKLAGLLHAAGFPALTPRPYPAFDPAGVPAPLPLPEALAAFCTDDPQERARRAHGRAFPDVLRGFRGDYSAAPGLVALPRDEAEIVAALTWAGEAGVPVVPFGGGTSVVGGTELPGALCLDLTRLDRVLEVDPVSRSARIQAGARGPGIEAQLAPHGLTLRHFPQSFELSTLGGWLATRAGGHFATRYTHIDDLVASIRMLTPAGAWESARLPGSGAGPSPDRMVLGSEGILGVITEAWMRLFAKPRWRSKATVHFADGEAAVAAVREISQAGLDPANCRLLDPWEAMLNQVAMGQHVLLLGFESAHHPVAGRLTETVAIATHHGGTVADGPTHLDAGEKGDRAGGAGTWREAFLRGPYRMSALVSLGVVVDTFETAIPWDRFEDLRADVDASVRAAMGPVGLLGLRFTHVYPDGPAPYWTFLCPAGPDALETWHRVKTAASDALLRHGATITHHHAVGRTHRPWYDRQRPGLFAQSLRAAKAELDPAGLLNPGVLIDP